MRGIVGAVRKPAEEFRPRRPRAASAASFITKEVDKAGNDEGKYDNEGVEGGGG